ncbi:response regulator [candidate division WOR-3 bacterium]|nr:response regulator [candidate division WOR-3 bacterium]
MKILWIDDEIELLKPFVYLLQKEGYEVQTAPSGEDGVRLASKESFDLIFLDEIMPGVDGLEVLRKIKNENSQQLVVMVTKSEEENLMNQAYGGWVDDYITKPFSFNQLLSVLNRTLKRRFIIEEKMAEEYSMQLRTMAEPVNHEQWVEYYRNVVSWDTRLMEFGSKELKAIHEERKRNGNAGFAKYVENSYADMIRTKGPIMSHNMFPRIVFPALQEGPVYFILFDSMRLDQYMKLVPFLKGYYEITTHYCYSLLPTATPYSRNAIFAGLLPLEIVQRYPQYWTYDERGQNRFERELLSEQLRRNNLRANFSFYKLSSITEIERNIQAIKGESTDIVIVVINFFDILIHSIPGRGDLKGILDDERVLLNILAYWFPMSPVFELFRSLMEGRRRVILTTDHGFIRVRRPSIIYGGREISPNLRYKYGPALRVDKKTALLLNNPGDIHLPSEDPSVRFAIAKEDYYFIYPTKPTVYEREFKYTFQHGGISTEEMILPLGILTPRS